MSSPFPSSFTPLTGEDSKETAGFPSSFTPLLEESSPSNIIEMASAQQKEKEPNKAEQFGKEGARHLARSGSRIAETLGGLPGDVQRLLYSGIEKLTGKQSTGEGLLPGSQELRKTSENIFGNIVKPQSSAERFLDDIVADAAALAIPVKGKIPFKRAIGTALAGIGAQKGAEALAIGQSGQNAAKLGTYFLASLTGRGNVKNFWREQYKEANESIPKGARISTQGIEKKIKKVNRELNLGDPVTPSKNFVRAPLKELEKKVRPGSISPKELVEFKKNINERRSSLYTDLTGKQQVKYAQGKINDLSNAIDESLKEYGKQNPKFYGHFKSANEAYGGFQQSKKVGNWFSRQFRFPGLTKGALLIGEAILKPATLPASIAGYGTFKLGEIIARMTQNPTLAKYYLGFLKGSIKENSAVAGKNLRNLSQEIEKEYPDFYDQLTSQNKANN